ncbi:hypothetical protein NQT62_12485 [Limnobacter humi]|uniref:DUF4148 domain-containing protein n=1 Tax=Limnobacter humi TaxID=1778671 RepID=A0ABT1WIA6_9BURK|nr:hypothetical protein [Limnobacter humi]MCQ8897252.1 hypothetical protein [Limnobacter humi]
MKLSKTSALIAVMFAGVLSANLATAQTPVSRDVRQQERIEQGVQSGQLTTKETAHLEKRESKIEAAEARAGADGKMTKAEHRRIERMQNRTSKDIYRQKHDRQTQ